MAEGCITDGSVEKERQGTEKERCNHEAAEEVEENKGRGVKARWKAVCIQNDRHLLMF